MRLSRATPADSERLKAYFASQPFPGPFELKMERRGGFFDKYNLYSKDYVTYFLEDERGEIHGMASLVFTTGLLNGEEQTIGYATDLRISNSRRAILSWSQHFLPVLERERQERECSYVFSAVANSQKAAMNAFIRPRTNRRELPRYHLYRKFDIMNVHARLPWAPEPLQGLNLRSASEDDLPLLLNFRNSLKSGIEVPRFKDVDQLREHLKSWIGMQLSDVKIIEDYRGEIQATYALWNPLAIEKLSAVEYTGSALSLRQGLRFFKWTGLTRPLPPTNSPLQFRFITFLQVTHPDVFESVLSYAWKQTNKNEFLVYPAYHGDLNLAPPSSYIFSKWKCGLFCIMAPHDPYPDFFYRSYEVGPPLWELAFL